MPMAVETPEVRDRKLIENYEDRCVRLSGKKVESLLS